MSNQAPKPSKFKIAWFCPLDIELEAATKALDLRYLTDDHEYKATYKLTAHTDWNQYRFGQIAKCDIVLYSMPGEENGQIPAATAYDAMKRSFPNVAYVFVVGIGGAIPQKDNKPDIRLGDVVVGMANKQSQGITQVEVGWQKGPDNRDLVKTLALHHPDENLARSAWEAYYQWKSTENSRHENFDKNTARIMASLNRSSPGPAKDKRYPLGFECTSTEYGECPCDPQHKDNHSVRDRQQYVYPGLVCSGSRVIQDATFRNALLTDNKSLGNCLCVETEGYAIAEKAACLHIRGLCDYADSHKTPEWHAYAAARAAAFAKCILESLSFNVETLQKSRGNLLAIPKMVKRPSNPSSSRSSTQSKAHQSPSRSSTKSPPAQGQKLLTDGRIKEQKLLTSESETFKYPEFYIPPESETSTEIQQDRRACDFIIQVASPSQRVGSLSQRFHQYGPYRGWCHVRLHSHKGLRPPGLPAKILSFTDASCKMEFWVPADGIKFTLLENGFSLYTWSDCESFVNFEIRGQDNAYACYNSAQPNLKLQIKFDRGQDVQEFKNIMLNSNLDDSSWRLLQNQMFLKDSLGRQILLFHPSEDSQTSMRHCLMIAEETDLRSHLNKFYLLETEFKLTLDIQSEVKSATISGILVTSHSTTEDLESERYRWQKRSCRGRPTHGGWASQEIISPLNKRALSPTPEIKLDQRTLGPFLSSILSWNSTNCAYVSVKLRHSLPGFKHVVLFWGQHNESQDMYLLIYSKHNSKPWSFLKVASGSKGKFVQEKARLDVPIQKRWSDTEKIRVNHGQTTPVNNGSTMLAIDFHETNEDFKKFNDEIHRLRHK